MVDCAPHSPQCRFFAPLTLHLLLPFLTTTTPHHQGIKAVREEVAAFISARDGTELPPADPEQVRWGRLSVSLLFFRLIKSVRVSVFFFYFD